MSKYTTRKISKTLLAAHLILLHTAKAQESTSSQNVTKVTSLATVSGSTITEIFTPTSISISGLVPPITAPITSTTTNFDGQTIAIAVAAGAGLVAGGGLAAWLFKPVPGGPPAPTSPPPFSTETLETTSTLTTSSTTSSTSSSIVLTCPYPTTGYPLTFASADTEDQWTLVLPTPSTTTAFSPQCTPAGSNNQLLRGTFPDYINALAQVFCKSDLSRNQNGTLGQNELSSDSSYKNGQLDGIRVMFDFEHNITNAGCAQNCIDAYGLMNTRCQYNSHVLYGGASLEQGPVYQHYDYRGAAVDAINNFCTARDGETVTQNDASTDINELTFSVTYASDCIGSGNYTVSKDTCISYLMQTLDGCDTSSTTYKHGGTLTDTDNCGAFSFHPTGYDLMVCFPSNQDNGYTSGSHVTITPDMAQDAISQFCDRSDDDQTYTLDPNNIPSLNDFSQDTCSTPGFAECTYYYNNDGSRVTITPDDVGDLAITLRAAYVDLGSSYACSTNVLYEVSGDRCRSELGKLIGIEPAGNCVGNDPNALDLGSFFESADKGCVRWDFFAHST